MTHVDILPTPTLPFPIFKISNNVPRYMLYDIDVISWLRKTHNILGVLIGTLPQIPQQNVFLGLALELQPEEARLLIDKKLAFIVDDLTWHTNDVSKIDTNLVQAMKADARRWGLKAAQEHMKSKQDQTQKVLGKLQQIPGSSEDTISTADTSTADENNVSEESLFDDIPSGQDLTESVRASSQSSGLDITPWTSNPTASGPPFATPPMHAVSELPKVNPSSYALFAHLHSKGYFMTPGIRFGCQFSVYPGDPLRFHSHFLSKSYDWDEEINLLDLIGGGRLGTGVKKGWLIGGPVAQENSSAQEGEDSQVRTFCIEWGGM